MKKYMFLLFFSMLLLGGKAQKINVVSVSEENDLHNFYTMMKEAFSFGLLMIPDIPPIYLFRHGQTVYLRYRRIHSGHRHL